MSQSDFGTIDPNTKSGTDLASDLNDFRDALHSMHLGGSAPSYAAAGMLWGDNTSGNYIYKAYDGTDHIPVFQLDATNNVVRVAMDNDGDSYIVCAADDVMSFYTQNTKQLDIESDGTLTLTAGMTLGADIDMNGNDLQFSDATGIVDANGNELLVFQTTASAVNQIDVTNAATGNNPSLDATGDDTHVSLLLGAKGNGLVKPTSGAGVDSYALGNLNSATTLKIANGNIQHATMTGSFTLTAPNDTEEGYIEVEFTIDGTGGYTLTLSGFNEISGTIDTTASVVNLLRIGKHNTNTYIEIAQAA